MARSSQKGHSDRVLRYVSGGVFLESGGYDVKHIYSEVDDPVAEYFIGTPIEDAYTAGFGPVGKISIGSMTGSIDPTVWTDGDPSTRHVTGDAAELLAMHLCPPSVFSGKLRLYVQSLYGSKRKDYAGDISAGSGTWPKLIVNEIELTYRGIGGCFLVTTPDYRYFICHVATGTLNDATVPVVFRELDPVTGAAGAVNALRQRLQDDYPSDYDGRGNAEAQIVESILFTLLEPAADPYQTIEIPSPANGGIVFGTPLEYSWHATWGGAQAKLVSITVDTLSFGIAGRVMTLDITQGEDAEGALQFGATLLSSGGAVEARIANDIFVWVPNGYPFTESYLPTTFYMCGIRDVGTIVPDPPEYWENLPTYGFFDEFDSWQLVTLSREELGTNDYGMTPPSMWVCGFGSVTGEWVDSSTTVQGYALTVGADKYEANEEYFPSKTTALSTITAGDRRAYYTQQWKYVQGGNITLCPDTTNIILSDTEAPPWGDTNYGYDNDFGLYSSYRETLDAHTDLGIVALIIPAGDCSAVVAGTKERHPVVRTRSWTEDPHTITGWQPAVINAIYDAATENELWSGEAGQEKPTLYNGGWDAAYMVSEISWPGEENIIGMHYHYSGGAEGLTVASGRDDELDDMNSFFSAPYGICTTGERTISEAPMGLCSGVYQSFSGSGSGAIGDSMEEINTDDYPIIDTFCGWS